MPEIERFSVWNTHGPKRPFLAVRAEAYDALEADRDHLRADLAAAEREAEFLRGELAKAALLAASAPSPSPPEPAPDVDAIIRKLLAEFDCCWLAEGADPSVRPGPSCLDRYPDDASFWCGYCEAVAFLRVAAVREAARQGER